MMLPTRINFFLLFSLQSGFRLKNGLFLRSLCLFLVLVKKGPIILACFILCIHKLYKTTLLSPQGLREIFSERYLLVFICSQLYPSCLPRCEDMVSGQKKSKSHRLGAIQIHISPPKVLSFMAHFSLSTGRFLRLCSQNLQPRSSEFREMSRIQGPGLALGHGTRGYLSNQESPSRGFCALVIFTAKAAHILDFQGSNSLQGSASSTPEHQ